jgi:hypothetical protein
LFNNGGTGGNAGNANGAGVYIDSGTSTLINDTIASNSGKGGAFGGFGGHGAGQVGNNVGLDGTPGTAGYASGGGVFSAGQTQQITNTVTLGNNGITTAGNISVVVTAAGETGSPVTVTVAVATTDTPTTIAANIAAALNMDPDVSAFATATSSGPTVVLTANVPAATDPTFTMSFADAQGAGGAAGLNSTKSTLVRRGDVPTVQIGNTIVDLNTANGSLNTDTGNFGQQQISNQVVLGKSGITKAGTITVQVQAANLNSGNPVSVNVSVLTTDTATSIASKIVTALNASTSPIHGFATATSAGAIVTLTVNAAVANDPTFNMSFADNTAIGVTTSLTAAQVRLGVANPITSLGGNVFGSSGGVSTLGNDKTGVTAAHLVLGNLANHGGPTLTDSLGTGSVALTAGDIALLTFTGVPSGAFTFDQRGLGHPRTINSKVAAGAFE